MSGHETAAWVYDGDEQARPLLMVHGFRGDHHGMDLIAGEIRDRTVIVPDLPGFGETSPLHAGLGLNSYIDFLSGLVIEITRVFGLPPIVLGHSFGSILVSHLAAHSPETTPELILVNPITTPALEGSARFLTGLTKAYYELGARLPHRAGHALLSNPIIVRAMSEVMATTRDPGTRAYIHDQHARYFSSFADRSSLAEAYETSVSHTVTEVAESLSMPTLVIAGDRDAIAPIGATRSFVAELADATFVELGGVGHLVHYERSEAAASAIGEFVRTRT
ncbi:alpha/beta fold hydrolase [Brevibacterium spongiae]|uniref:Alpha/beta hydrolase n=1 Tax=Brevibacterium spongiae TaxID=2909672 RepID=A0ABY5SXA9_9MICO|nr:alpha/beta hydrolase [Brevibacterium spongiae]UVI37726.1 alpha/beta hydrolase [Brevibacterium spongiae]